MRYLLLLGLAAFNVASGLENNKPCVCPLNWKPVCGTDGVTYPNECILKCVKLALKPDLEVAYQGACKHVQQSLQEAKQEEEVEWREVEEFKQFVKDPCICPKIWQPVCGSDVRTYANECTLNCARSRGKPELWLVRRTLCEYIPLEELRKSKCACNTNNLPVCGNDGKTYRNPCELYCTSIFKISGLDLAEYGPCQ